MTAVVLCGPERPSTLNPTLIRTQTQPLAISAQLLKLQALWSSGPRRQETLPMHRGSWLLGQDLGANAQRILQGAASLNLGFQTFLPKGRDYLIHK
ncbi:hypothetical protein DPMN_019683, partial [Dreissena polymorpha]